jgi:hypothetical protein
MMNREYVDKLFDRFVRDIAITVDIEVVTYDIFHDEITQYKTHKVGKNYCMNIVECNDVFMLYTDKISPNLHYCDDIIDTLVHKFDLIVVSKKEMNVLCYLERANIYTSDKYETIDICFDTYKIYKNHIGVYHIVFVYDNIRYCCTKKNIFTLSDNKAVNDTLLQYLLDGSNSVKHFIIINAKLKKILCHEYNDTKYCHTIDKNVIFIKEEFDDDTIKLYDKQIYFSCLDELLFENEESSIENEITRKLTSAGYILMNGCEKIVIENTMYRKINDSIPEYQNVHMCYLDLYKSDKLNEVLPYMSNYYMDIIKRINISMKTMAKEILNIYHLTRNKDNNSLYTCLPNSYKKVLYDLHKIFIEERDREFKTDDIRKSITVDDVYHYLKRISNTQLFNVYSERNELIKNVTSLKTYDDVVYINCIDTKTQTELMFV